MSIHLDPFIHVHLSSRPLVPRIPRFLLPSFLPFFFPAANHPLFFLNLLSSEKHTDPSTLPLSIPLFLSIYLFLFLYLSLSWHDHTLLPIATVTAATPDSKNSNVVENTRIIHSFLIISVRGWWQGKNNPKDLKNLDAKFECCPIIKTLKASIGECCRVTHECKRLSSARSNGWSRCVNYLGSSTSFSNKARDLYRSIFMEEQEGANYGWIEERTGGDTYTLTHILASPRHTLSRRRYAYVACAYVSGIHR